MKIKLILLAVILNSCTSEQKPGKIIDMHIHSYDEKDFIDTSIRDHYGVRASNNAETHFTESYESFKKNNIVKVVVSGSLKSVDQWKSKDTENRIIRGLLIFHPTDDGMDSTRFEQLIKDGKIEIFGEVAPYYSGTTLSDSVWQPYLRICEKYDIPVAVHTGGGEPRGTYTWSPKARLKFGDPYLIEEVLVRYPKLRIYMMHAGGEDWPEHGIRLMAYYPQLYTDIAVMLWVEPNTQRYIKEFLRNAKDAGYLDRIMFGSDQMLWPYAIQKSIDFLNGLDFLTKKEKENIFYNNAARFLKIKN